DPLRRARVERRVRPEPASEVRLASYGGNLRAFVEQDLLIVSADGDVPGSVQERGLGAERGVDGLHRHAGCGCDVGHRRAAEPLLDEQVPRRTDDHRSVLVRLGTTARAVVRPTLDGIRHFRYTCSVLV